MAIDYDKVITKTQKQELLKKRINEMVYDAYQLSINLKVVEGDANNTEIIQKQIDEYEKAIDIHVAEHNALND